MKRVCTNLVYMSARFKTMSLLRVRWYFHGRVAWNVAPAALPVLKGRLIGGSHGVDSAYAYDMDKTEAVGYYFI